MKAMVLEEIGKPMMVEGVARARMPSRRCGHTRGGQRYLPLGLASMARRLGMDRLQDADADRSRP